MDKTILEQLSPKNSMLLMIDLQPQMAFGVANIYERTSMNSRDSELAPTRLEVRHERRSYHP